ncbi:MAG: hypothetical protein JXA82_01785 [Sedimentisphaerales bacterium]|nr:hypothetical protein [Sedimentisphaerales bacterium]
MKANRELRNGNVKPPRHVKICLAASAGGHASQLRALAAAWEGYPIFWTTTTEVLRRELEKTGKTYVVGESNRNHPFRIISVLLKCIRIILRERPTIVISTGASVGCIMCFLCKFLCRGKIIWMDSITNVHTLSLSGRLVRPISNLFFVQWPELEEKYKKVQYLGTVL